MVYDHRKYIENNDYRTIQSEVSIPLIRSEERVIVIGSGFGGGVSALRLAQAGVPVLVHERGLRWSVQDLLQLPVPGDVWLDAFPVIQRCR